ncbi:hypothetical protein TRAPUB_14278 [Trametes pubescens]|uniref:Fungal-type protein kinase domain-containing protein n=1 Tax=Trametes pubescens TaxID=154538 RepID=A0A1M2VNV3_TRAPU|nr:hypothetical protein TRAPUB_14278 [Trametes pubescens]
MLRHSTGEKFWDQKRNHKTTGINNFVRRPLTEFTSTRELVLAIRDAIRGHKRVWEEAQVLHRDGSLSNILIKDKRENDDNDALGMLHDFDYSYIGPIGVNGNATKDVSNDRANTPRLHESIAITDEATQGSYFFIALDHISLGPSNTHHPYHDLESFCWVVLWVVLRHTRCALCSEKKSGKQVYALFFKHDSWAGAAMKLSWALPNSDSLGVAGNVPLTTLMTRFKALVTQQTRAKLMKRAEVALTHHNVLQIFDEVLELDGWPENDWTPCDIGEDLDPPSPRAPNVCGIPPGYPPNMSEAQRNAMIRAGKAAACGYLPRNNLRVKLPNPVDRSQSQIISGSGLKRPLAEADQLPDPSEAPSAPKKSKNAIEPPPPPEAASVESSVTKSRGCRTRSSSRITEEETHVGEPSGAA